MHQKTISVVRVVDGEIVGEPTDIIMNNQFGTFSFRDAHGNLIHASRCDRGISELLETLETGGSKEPPKTVLTEGTDSFAASTVKVNNQWTGR